MCFRYDKALALPSLCVHQSSLFFMPSPHVHCVLLFRLMIFFSSLSCLEYPFSAFLFRFLRVRPISSSQSPRLLVTDSCPTFAGRSINGPRTSPTAALVPTQIDLAFFLFFLTVRCNLKTVVPAKVDRPGYTRGMDCCVRLRESGCPASLAHRLRL